MNKFCSPKCSDDLLSSLLYKSFFYVRSLLTYLVCFTLIYGLQTYCKGKTFSILVLFWCNILQYQCTVSAGLTDMYQLHMPLYMYSTHTVKHFTSILSYKCIPKCTHRKAFTPRMYCTCFTQHNLAKKAGTDYLVNIFFASVHYIFLF